MRLEIAGVSEKNIKGGLSFKIPATARKKQIKEIFSHAVSEMTEWIELCDTKEIDIQNIVQFGEQVNKKYDNFVVLGIGGSALGIKMLQNTFVDSINKDTDTKVYVCDNIDGDYFLSLMNTLNLKKTMFNVITKSGSTSETLAQMLIMMERIKEKKLALKDHFCVTTTKGNALYNFAVENNMTVFDIPRGVGGRFSVLSPVGLVPAAVMGIDIRGLLAGAKIARENAKLEDMNNLAYTSAYINYSYLKKGLTNLVMMPYSDRLKLVPDFFAQLWAESLGKKVNKQGEVVYAGQTPIKTLGVTDQHSQLQLYSEGIKDKVIMFITVDKAELDARISSDLEFCKHLDGANLKQLLDYECDSTAYSLTTLNRPNYTVALEEISEKSIGELIFYMEMMTAFMGEMMGIDTYDQPGVELSKIYTKACLKMKGYEKQGTEIKTFAKNKKDFILK